MYVFVRACACDSCVLYFRANDSRQSFYMLNKTVCKIMSSELPHMKLPVYFLDGIKNPNLSIYYPKSRQ